MSDKPSPSSPGKVALWNNVISLFGFVVAGLAVMLLSTFTWFNVVSPVQNPYVDVIGFLVLPGFLIIGLTLIPIGVWIKYRRVRRKDPAQRVTVRLHFDVDNPIHRRRLIAFLTITFVIVLPLVGVSSYHGYHYTDSTEFCAKVCHSVMEPQAVAFERSPHARVACAECHIGPGADWFVKSKLSGTRQVLAVLADTYPRPIPPAITELRPARDTCEHCHWPAKFFGSQLKTVVHFGSDEQNTRREVMMLLKTGGADSSTGRTEGIHMHMALSGSVDYVATDEGLQQIPWVRYTAKDGAVTVYRSDGRAGHEAPPKGIVRRVDCMDCHNRAAHLFRTPQQAVQLALESGQLDRSLPFLKREAVAVLSEEYPDRGAAHAAIRQGLTKFYGEILPPDKRPEGGRVEQAIQRVIDLYGQNFFPEMKVAWHTYPDNIGHVDSPGCMRCHDGLHVADSGLVISSDCNTCHTFLNRSPDQPATLLEGEFQHSMPLTQHPNLRCHQCHSGGPLPTCAECHESGEWLDTRGQGAFERTQTTTDDQPK